MLQGKDDGVEALKVDCQGHADGANPGFVVGRERDEREGETEGGNQRDCPKSV